MRRWTCGWALALGACGPVVDVGPGTDAETGDPDDSTTSTTSTTASTATSAGPSTTSLDTSASASASVSVSVSTTVDPTTEEPPPVDNGYCAPACNEPVDCCMGEPTCEAGLGTYPYDWGCDNGACTFGGCTSDEDCTFGGVLMGYICVDVDGTNACMPSCNSDQDCEDQFLTGWVCNGTYCEQPPCSSDEECGPDLMCSPDSGTCVYACSRDDVCGGFGHCDPDSGACVCSSDAECMEGYACTPVP